MAIGYYGVKLSDNVTRTPEGFLIFRDAVIARTGFQTYRGSEIPDSEKQAVDLNIGPDEEIQILRPANEVFSRATIQSYEGKPITDGHPSELVTVNNISNYQCGHIQNVRQGMEALEDGNFPLLADLVVTDSLLIDKWASGMKQLSAGYQYNLAKDTNTTICQVNNIGNHVAFVPNGRAGNAEVKDESPQPERKPVMSLRKKIMALGLKAFSQTETPENIALAMDELGSTETTTAPAASTATAVVKAPAATTAKTTASDEETVPGADRRKRLHDALDRRLDEEESNELEQEAMDTESRKELRELMADEDCNDEEEEPDGEDEEKEEEEGEGEDEVPDGTGTPEIPAAERTHASVPEATDAAFRSGAVSVLKVLKPLIAKSSDKKLKAAFDTAIKTVAGHTRQKKTGNYGKFARAAATMSDAAKAQMNRTPAEVAAAQDKIMADSGKAKNAMYAGRR